MKPTGEVHPAAAVFPMLPDDELDALADSIADVGLLQPIVLTPDGAVLDGRNRLAACSRAGTQPTFEIYDGDPIAFVAAANVNRRHMTTGARAMAVAVMLADSGRRGNGRWDRDALPANPEVGSKTWANSLTEAGHVVDHAPDLAPLVIAGTQSLNAAHQAALMRRVTAMSEQARMATLTDVSPDLAVQVTEERLSLAEAEAAYAARERKRVDERRDARTLLTRIVDLTAPEQIDNGFVEAWAGRLGDVEPELIDRINAAIGVLTDLAKRVQE